MDSYILKKVLPADPEAIIRKLSQNGDKEIERLQKNISKLQADLSKSQTQLNSDNSILCGLYASFSKTEKDGLIAAEEVNSAIEELRALEKEMRKSLFDYAKTGWGSGRTAEEMFMELIDPMLAAVSSLSSVIQQMGLPQLPIVDQIPTMLQKFSSLGKIISKMPKEIKNAARKEAEEARKLEEAEEEEAEKAAIEKAKKNGGNQTWALIAYRYNNSPLKDVIDGIVKAFNALLDAIEMICSCAEIFAILLIIDKFKPIIDQFKIIVGDAVTILENVDVLLKQIIVGKFSMLELLGQLIWEKVRSVWDILVYACCSQGLTTNALISGCWADIVSAECDISSISFKLGTEESKLQLLIDNKTEEKYSDKIEKIEKYIENLKSKKDIDPEIIRSQTIEKDFLLKKKEKLVEEDYPYHKDQLAASMDISESFEENRAKIYAATLDSKLSLDKYLNPNASEEK